MTIRKGGVWAEYFRLFVRAERPFSTSGERESVDRLYVTFCVATTGGISRTGRVDRD